MRNSTVQPVTVRNAPKVVVALLWIVAIGAPASVLYSSEVEKARHDGETALLEQVATRINGPSTGREDLLSFLTQKRQEEVGAGKFSRTARRLGVANDWPSLFAEIGRRGKQDQEMAARVIAQECGLAADLSLEQEQAIVGRPSVPYAIRHKLPVLAPPAGLPD